MQPFTRLHVLTTPLAGVGLAPLAGTFVPFSQVGELEGVKVKGVFAVNAVLITDVLPDGAVCPTNSFDFVIRLSGRDTTERLEFPLAALDFGINGGVVKSLVPFVVDWTRSGVFVVGAPAASLGNRLSLPLVFDYIPAP